MGYTIQKQLSTFWGTARNKCLLLRVQFSTGRYHTPNTVAVGLIVAIGTWIHAGTIQAQKVASAVIVRSRRPIAAARATIAHRTTVDVAGIEEVIRELSKGFGGCITTRIGCSVIIISTSSGIAVVCYTTHNAIT